MNFLSTFLKKVLIWLKNVTCIKKMPISKVESFLNSNFWPKPNMKNSACTKPLNLEFERDWIALYFYWSAYKCFGVIKTVKKLELQRDWAKLGPNICLLRQSQTKYLQQSSKEKFAICFCVFFNYLLKSKLRLSTRPSVHPNLRLF